MIKVHSLLDTRHLVYLPHIAPDIRVVYSNNTGIDTSFQSHFRGCISFIQLTNNPLLGAEMLGVNSIKPNESREETYVCLSECVTDQVPMFG